MLEPNPDKALRARADLTDDQIITFMKAYLTACGDLTGSGGYERYQVTFNCDYVLYAIELSVKTDKLFVRSLASDCIQDVPVNAHGMFDQTKIDNEEYGHYQNAMNRLRKAATTGSVMTEEDLDAYYLNPRG